MSTAVSVEGNEICQLCRRQFSKYTCPTCNVPYCSLTCFRSQSHSHCSETFYKKELESDIRSEPSKTARERMEMMDLLKRFEKESAEEEEAEDIDDVDSDPEALEQRFRDLDIDSTSSDVLWDMLTPPERAKFMKALGDPSSDLAQELLSNEVLENGRQEPWWEAPTPALPATPKSRFGRPFGRRPDVMSIPPTLLKPYSGGTPLIYNICAVCIAYAYITRHLAKSPLSSVGADDPDAAEVQRLVSQLIPVLATKSATVFPNLTSVVTDLWSHFDLGEMNSATFALILKDGSNVIRPLSVVALDATPPGGPEVDIHSHPFATCVLVLSDLWQLYRARGPKHVTHKLTFYAAHLLSLPPEVVRAVSDELSERSQAVYGEGQHGVAAEPPSFQKKTAVIEVISANQDGCRPRVALA
ncbi:hypothetical protein BD779DRAFT_340036 [Infundibulicybe gibba]|nr:hypothetical protein BD779DRAFT_340036 [Infundibulicybe gibba]